MISGIYLIENTVNNKKYIGSSKNITKRWYVHKSTLKHNHHENSYLQKAWNKYGANNFKFIIIEENETINLLKREQYYIDYYDTTDRNNGYNLMPIAGNNLGYKHTEEAKLKMSNLQKGKKLSEETKENMRIAATKKDKSYYSNPERNIKLSKANIGKKLSEETKRKISESKRGKKLSEETKRKISESNKGRKYSEETKRKISNALMGNKNGLGRIVTEETKKNISISHIGINRGEKNGRAMATTNKEVVIAIRKDYSNSLSISELMIKYKRKYTFIYNIVKRISWAWLDDSSFSN